MVVKNGGVSSDTKTAQVEGRRSDVCLTCFFNCGC